jgi:hypothetical protein
MSKNYLDIVSERIMIDTIGMRIGNVDPARLPKKFAQVGSDDDAKWAKGSLETEASKQSLEVRAIKSKREFNITGSPAFHRQGHNIISSNDLPMLAFAAVQDLNRELGLDVKYWSAAEFAKGRGIHMSRIDTPVLVGVPSGISSADAINAMDLAGIAAGNNTSIYIGQSVYFDQNSQLASLKAYDKDVEISRRRRWKLPNSSNADKLRELAGKTIRLEAVFRQKYLQRRFKDRPLEPAQLTPEVLAEMFLELFDRYTLKRDIRKALNEEEMLAVPRRFRPALSHWQAGFNVRKMLGGNETEYSRCHAFLKNMYSINIEMPPPAEMLFSVELGAILSPNNFVAIPDELRADPELFLQLNMDEIREELDDRVACRKAA